MSEWNYHSDDLEKLKSAGLIFDYTYKDVYYEALDQMVHYIVLHFPNGMDFEVYPCATEAPQSPQMAHRVYERKKEVQDES